MTGDGGARSLKTSTKIDIAYLIFVLILTGIILIDAISSTVKEHGYRIPKVSLQDKTRIRSQLKLLASSDSSCIFYALCYGLHER